MQHLLCFELTCSLKKNTGERESLEILQSSYMRNRRGSLVDWGGNRPPPPPVLSIMVWQRWGGEGWLLTTSRNIVFAGAAAQAGLGAAIHSGKNRQLPDLSLRQSELQTQLQLGDPARRSSNSSLVTRPDTASPRKPESLLVR